MPLMDMVFWLQIHFFILRKPLKMLEYNAICAMQCCRKTVGSHGYDCNADKKIKQPQPM